MRQYKDMETVEFMSPEGIAMYTWVWEGPVGSAGGVGPNPEADDQGIHWYGLLLRFPKDKVNEDELKAMRRQFMVAAREGWPKGTNNDGTFDSDFASPLRDGDKFDKANNKRQNEELFGCWYMSFKSKTAP